MANGKPTSGQLFAGIVTLALTAITALNAWGLSRIIDNSERITYIEATDAVNDDWLKERLDRFQAQLDRIEAKQGNPD